MTPPTIVASGIIVTAGDAGTKAWLAKQNLALTNTPTEAFAQGYILVAGQGLPKSGSNPSQQRLTALRAAEVAAYRRLAEILDGVTVSGQVTVRDCTLSSDLVKAAVNGFVRGARKVYESWNPEEGVATVLMEVGINGANSVTDVMYQQYINAPDGRASLQTVAYKPSETGLMMVTTSQRPPPSTQASQDGLIIDARDLDFHPALINRIFTRQGESLYDPSKISQKILVEQGAGEYTNTLEKAHAALEARGAKTPLVIKALGLKSPADLLVSDDDAVRIFSADQKINFLASAKVVFVLK
ncbi:MAG TPA: hypothetical protein PLW81_13570 [Thiobacillaceae bacterium]|nr:hypothetical protein [Thiobacillaceae bacterium]